ncbi:MAG: hypothetical protein ACLTCI_09645 [[Clostridium] nexile]
MKDSRQIYTITHRAFYSGVYNMSVKIKISYTDEELEEFTRPLSSLNEVGRNNRQGKYKRAYGILSHERSPNKHGRGLIRE